VSVIGRAIGCLLLMSVAGCMPPSWAANALLHPARRPVTQKPGPSVEAVQFDGAGVQLQGWWFRAPAAKRGTVV